MAERIDVLKETRDCIMLRHSNELTKEQAEKVAGYIKNWLQSLLQTMEKYPEIATEGDVEELKHHIELDHAKILMEDDYDSLHRFYRWLDEEEILVFDISRMAELKRIEEEAHKEMQEDT